ncbi:protein kinase domain-containing protein [Goodfellowiella coeruleoviolacea]|uniref:non-specific serine/threonine protein kinase n=1 Tax=Goodfellowiella coeruleoviolacea TaxID=334858 RepID=A0AAE3GHG2_9PSEU|nr:protein kinase [Goodfellowiella coeruleoviolacea]MCP2167445.1 Protein kinase domain-containing protein [Goodfellowiella coeruleoviolacea]
MSEEQGHTHPARARPGFHVGPPDDPDRYRLDEAVGRGGEGEVWLATTARRDGSTRHRWAVKVLHAEHLQAGHDESPAQALARWHARVSESLDETSQLQHGVAGVVGASHVFIGAEPHPPGDEGDARTLYVVSPWIEGRNLVHWLKEQPTFEQVCAVAARLAEIVDGLASGPLAVVHRDISPANVVVQPSGSVCLIDFTFAVPTRSGPVTAIRNPGYTAPEARAGSGSPEADRYSFGAVVHFLLTGRPPDESNAEADSRATLVRANFPAAVADHVAALLATDPARRPTALVPWVAELADKGAVRSRSLHYGDLDLAVDGSNTTVVTASGTTVLSRARLGAGAMWALVPDREAPTAPVSLRSATDGTGTTVDFVVDKAERLWVGRAGEWRDAGGAAPAGGIAIVRLANGSTAAFTVDPVADRLTRTEVRVDGSLRRVAAGPHARRVLAAANDADGEPVVVAVAPDGELVGVAADDVRRLGPTGIAVAALCLNTWGELQCFAVPADTGGVITLDQLHGSWTPSGDVEVPGRVIDLACVGHRDGVTVAVACDEGLWVATHSDGLPAQWQRLTDQPCHRVALGVGAAWRLRLAAIVDGRVAVATEDFTGRWSTALRTL